MAGRSRIIAFCAAKRSTGPRRQQQAAYYGQLQSQEGGRAGPGRGSLSAGLQVCWATGPAVHMSAKNAFKSIGVSHNCSKCSNTKTKT